MVEMLDRPQKFAYHYAQISYGDGPTIVRYTNWHAPSDGAFTFEPALEVRPAEITGTFDTKQTVLSLPLRDAFSLWVSRDEPKPRIKLVLRERLEDPLGVVDAQELTIFRGQLSKVVRNSGGKASSISLYFDTIKAQPILQKLGIVASEQCAFTLGGRGCQVDLSATHQTGTVDSLQDGRVAIISGLGATPDGTYWLRGDARRDGLSIAIREWSAVDPTRFVLSDRAPADWVGQDVVLTPGCDKSLAQCRARWNNEAHFGGFGIGMPDYSPNFEG